MNDSHITSTSPSLIVRAKRLDPAAWERLCHLYTPLVYGWARKAGLQESDAADIVQDVFQAVAEGMIDFEHGDDQPPFRGWLWGITRHKVLDHFRRAAKSPQARGGSTAQHGWVELAETEPMADDSSVSDKDIDQIAWRALQLMKSDFRESTWRAFWRVTIENESAADVAGDLGLSVAAVYTAKSRVLARLRSEMAGLS